MYISFEEKLMRVQLTGRSIRRSLNGRHALVTHAISVVLVKMTSTRRKNAINRRNVGGSGVFLFSLGTLRGREASYSCDGSCGAA